jgi:hypothetical protein
LYITELLWLQISFSVSVIIRRKAYLENTTQRRVLLWNAVWKKVN